MKKIALLIIFTSCLILSSQGYHLAGGNITFTYTGTPNQYLVQLILYRDCSGISMSTTDTVCVHSSNCSYDSYIVLTTTSVSQLGQCFNMINFGPTTCNGGQFFGIEKYIYSGSLILPFPCSDWELVYSGLKGTAISTLSMPTIILKTQFDNLNFPTNSSPFFANDPCFDACVNTGLCYSMAALDIDADTVSYFEPVIDTSANGTCPQVYAPYSNPLYNISQYSQLDSITGLFCFNVPLIMGSIVPYAISDVFGNMIKSTVYGYNLLSISNNNICTTGINEIKDALNFTLSPNTATNYIQLSFVKTPANGSIIYIYNTLGRKVKSKKNIEQDKVDISIADLSAGIYLVEVICENTKQVARFVKQ